MAVEDLAAKAKELWQQEKEQHLEAESARADSAEAAETSVDPGAQRLADADTGLDAPSAIDAESALAADGPAAPGARDTVTGPGLINGSPGTGMGPDSR